MVEIEQLFQSLDRLTVITSAKIEGNLKAMLDALSNFRLEDYKNIAQFVVETLGIDRECNEWKEFIEIVSKMARCSKCGRIIERNDIGRDFGKGLYLCRACKASL